MAMIPWLLLVILLGTVYPTYLLTVRSQEAFREKSLELIGAQAAFEFYQSSNEERDDLQAQIDSASSQRDAILQSLGGLQLSTSKWSPTLFQIEAIIPQGISLSDLSQQGNSIRLDGTSDQYNLVINLLDSLLTLDSLKQVEIDSIERIDQEDLSVPVLEDEGDTSVSTEEEQGYYRFTIIATTLGEVAP
jgi:Tfp pilus assembly protein PilN